MTACLTHAEKYYKSMGEKNINEVKKALDADVEFYAPLGILKGKPAVIAAISEFMSGLSSLKIRAKFGDENQAMIVYDVDFPGIADTFPGASLLTFRNDKIVRIELFHDNSRFAKS